MTQQTHQLIEAGYVTRKQAAAILGKGDGSNITEMCHRGGVKFIEIPRGDKRVTTLFWGEDVVRLFAKMDRKNRPKQTMLPEPPGKRLSQDTFFTPPNMQKIVEDSVKHESEMMLALGRIEAMLTALLKR